jgi:magnesium-transporting ATPase (P-type)
VLGNMTVNTGDNAKIKETYKPDPNDSKATLRVESDDGNKTDCAALKFAKMVDATTFQKMDDEGQRTEALEAIAGTEQSEAERKQHLGKLAAGKEKEGIDFFLEPKSRHDSSKVNRKAFPFSSENKYMAVLLPNDEASPDKGLRVYTKGASEIILEVCDSQLKWNGSAFEKVALTQEDKVKIVEVLDSFAADMLRTIGLAYKDVDAAAASAALAFKGPGAWEPGKMSSDDPKAIALVKSGLTWVGTMAAEDPLRPEVFIGLGRIVALYCCSSTLHRIH